MNEIDKNLTTILEGELVGEVETIEPETVGEVTTIEPTNIELHTNTTNVNVQPDVNQDVEFDYELSRSTHKELLEQGQEALTGILKVADASQHPRAYEVAAVLLKNLSDMTDKLMNLHKVKKELQKDQPNQPPAIGNIEQAVFVGSTSELLKKINKKK